MNKIILTLIFTLVINFCHAQKIEFKETLNGYKYIQNGNEMSMTDLVNTMRSNPQAFNLISEARSNKNIIHLMTGVGSGLIVLPFTKAYLNGDTFYSHKNINWTPSIIGATLIAITIPISERVTKKKIQAVDLYNSQLNSTSFHKYKPEFKVLANNNGIGLLVHF